MTEDEIKTEFSRHPRDSRIMQAFRAWLDTMRDAAEDTVCGGCESEHYEHRNAGKLSQAKYALMIFDGVLDENEKRRRKADDASH